VPDSDGDHTWGGFSFESARRDPDSAPRKVHFLKHPLLGVPLSLQTSRKSPNNNTIVIFKKRLSVRRRMYRSFTLKTLLRWWSRSDDAVVWTAAVVFHSALLLWVLHLIVR
jgi:hypothetical protein